MGEASRATREHHQLIREELNRRVDAALDRGARGDLDALVALLEGDLLEHGAFQIGSQRLPLVGRGEVGESIQHSALVLGKWPCLFIKSVQA